MKNAPFKCPRCGEEKSWNCLNDPTVNIQMDKGRPMADATVASIIPVLGLIFGIPTMIRSTWIRLKQMWNRHFLVYKCGNCGHKGFFRADNSGYTDPDDITDIINRGRNKSRF